jgi:LysR family glycine cleavage system transcriptional activator
MMRKIHLLANMLPSLPALRAFDGAARFGSFRAAAEHLNVTPTAISHHIRALETQLGTQLFNRIGRDVELTEDGRRLAQSTSQAFALLENAVDRARRGKRRVVRLAAGPIFTARWLMPRISEFWNRHPGIDLEVLPTYEPRTLDPAKVEIVIRWERMVDMPASSIKLLELSPVAIASESFAARYGPFDSPEDLLSVPLLHQRNHWGWLDWFAAMGVGSPPSLRGSIFEDANVLFRGAADGQGAVVGWLPLIDQDLREGRVLRLYDESISPTHGYYVDIPGTDSPSGNVSKVLEWLSFEAG